MPARNQRQDVDATDPPDFLDSVNQLLQKAVTQHVAADYVHDTLQRALQIAGGKRGFMAQIDQETGELFVHDSVGEGWTPENRRIRLSPHSEEQRGITGHVAITGRAYLCNDVASDMYFIRAFADTRSEVAVPFFDAEGRVRGVLNIDSDRLNAFEERHLAMLSVIAGGLAAWMGFEEFRERERLLVEVGLELASNRDTGALARHVVDVATRALQCEACSVFLTDEAGENLLLHASSRLTEPVGAVCYRVGEGLTGLVAQNGRAVRIDNPRNHPNWVGKFPEFSHDELSAFLAAPIPGRERTIGVVRVSRRRSASPWHLAQFTESDERLLQTVAAQLGIAVENAWSLRRLVRSERMAAWGELSAKSAHMIGNRTFSIKGDLNELKYLLETHLNKGSGATRELVLEWKALADSIERGIFKLEDILREFRDFVVATQLHLRLIDIAAIVRETVAETVPRRTTVRLHEEYEAGIPLMLADGEKLKRALAELIENAVSFMPDGGRLSVSVARAASGTAPRSGRLSRLQNYVELVLADTGPGVPNELKERIFQPFFSSRVKGMGLGLSIVKGIIDAHHGEIRELGEPGAGASFRILLPLPSES